LISRLRRPLIYAVVAVLCTAGLAAAHRSRIIDNWHTTQWEDTFFFQYNDASIHSLSDCFVKGGPWPGLYRPLSTNLYYYLGSRLLDNRVESYHVINLVFVILNAVLLFRLAELLLGTWCAMIPAVLFASRIAMVEVVLNTCEFQGLSYTFFTIISVDLFVRSYRSDSAWPLTLSAFAFVLALFSKESAIVLPAVLVVYGWLFEDHIVTLRYLVHALIAILWVILFVAVLRPLSNNQPTGFGYDFSVSNVLRNYDAYFLAFSNLLLTPLENYIMPTNLAVLAENLYVRVLFCVLTLSEIAILSFPRFLKSQGLRVVVFGFAWFLITTLPFTIFADRLFMRYGYLGHAGLALCVGGLVESIVRWFSTRRSAALPQVAEPSHA
jgi:protein O-mannosyl-transferase